MKVSILAGQNLPLYWSLRLDIPQNLANNHDWLLFCQTIQLNFKVRIECIGREKWVLLSQLVRFSKQSQYHGLHADPSSLYWGRKNPHKENLLLLCGFPEVLWYCTKCLACEMTRGHWIPNMYGMGNVYTIWISVRKTLCFPWITWLEWKPTILTLLCLYINELSNYIERLGGLGACLVERTIWILLYAVDSVTFWLSEWT